MSSDSGQSEGVYPLDTMVLVLFLVLFFSGVKVYFYYSEFKQWVFSE